MHCELVIPGLFAAPAAARLAAAEMLLARGRCTSGPSQSLEAWLHEAFGLEQAPIALAGCDVATGLPPNPASPGHQLLNEAQMVLHTLPVNESRESRGEPPINSVWLWGAGSAPAVAAPPWQSVSAAEPLALGL